MVITEIDLPHTTSKSALFGLLKKYLNNLQVCAIFAITQLLNGAGYSYMPFYLTDYLRLQKVMIV